MKRHIITIFIGFFLVSCGDSQPGNYSTWIETERCTSYSYSLLFEGGESHTVSECTNWETHRVRRRQ